MDVKIEISWKKKLAHEFNQKYFENLTAFLKEEYQNKTLYPQGKDIFKAFDLAPFHEVKVVILGQDPYHQPHQAHGLAFSVKDNIKLPPSLKNIFTVLHHDLNIERPMCGNLEKWAKQGVFLLNTVLTVEAHKPNSHKNRGWEKFTDAVIKLLAYERENLVFILWGNQAKQKEILIDPTKHLILKSSHPSPFSAHYGFLESRPFSQTNQYLQTKNIKTIDWQLK